MGRITRASGGSEFVGAWHDGVVTDIPRGTVSRTVRLASLPLGFAGRAALGLGKKVTGLATDVVSDKVQQRTAEQLFSVLGQLKGGAMKLGQALSVFEAALPEHLAAPYRAALTRLQDAAPPLPAASVHRVLAAELGENWREQFSEFNDTPAASASIGQVHKAVWKDGREVAVKVQYPGAGQALVSDLKQLGRMSSLFRVLQPGIDIRPLIEELRDRVVEELDYQLEAESQRAFAEAYAGDPEILVPHVVAAADKVIVTEWAEGTPLAHIIADGSQDERDRAGHLMSTLHFSGPQRAGMLHADPHPGNFRISDDGRLVVLDFGAVARLPDGLPTPIGALVTLALKGEAEQVLEGLRGEGFIPDNGDVDAQEVLDFLLPMLAPIAKDEFQFSREWLRAEATRIANPKGPAYKLSKQLNLPPSYLLIHRVTMGSIGVLCQLEAQASWRDVLLDWLPGFEAE